MLQAYFIDPYLPQDLSFNGCEWLIILNELSFFELKRDVEFLHMFTTPKYYFKDNSSIWENL